MNSDFNPSGVKHQIEEEVLDSIQVTTIILGRLQIILNLTAEHLNLVVIIKTPSLLLLNLQVFPFTNEILRFQFQD
jgi:hypothetical protein